MGKKIFYLAVGLLALYGGWQFLVNRRVPLNLSLFSNKPIAGPRIVGSYPEKGAVEDSVGIVGSEPAIAPGGPGRGIVPPKPPFPPDAPVGNSEVEERLVIRNGEVRAVVGDVRQEKKAIEKKVSEQSGFVVNANLSQPEEAPHLTISVRVPAERLDELMDFVKDRSERITYESVTGEDVTSRYIDEKARLKSLEEARGQMSEILAQAQEISDLLQIQREIQRIDREIESAKGRIEYLEKSAALSLLNIELAQSEYELTYTPTQKWRPGFVFKQATRSLLTTLQNLSYFAIRAAVFAVIWLPAAGIAYLGYRLIRRKN